VKIIDLGVGREFNQTTGSVYGDENSFPGKKEYVAPEAIYAKEFNGVLADVYSCGVVLLTMFTGSLRGRRPYDTPFSGRLSKLVHAGKVKEFLREMDLSDHVDSGAVDLLSKMLSPPAKRITLHEVMAHHWLM